MFLGATLKLTGMLTLGWGWIIGGGLLASLLPMGLTIAFVVCKLTGVLAASWLWILPVILIDLGELANSLN